MVIFFLRLYLLFNLLGACTTYQSDSDRLWSQSTLNIQTLSLYNQRMSKVKDPSQNWLGDWLLRRERLELLDEELRSSAPNLIFFQEALQKKENIYNSDINILKASSLMEYHIEANEFKEYKDSKEVEFAVTALKLGANEKVETLNKTLWPLGQDGYLTYLEIKIDGMIYHFFNVKMPKDPNNLTNWYDYILQRVKGSFSLVNTCLNHLVIAGYFEGEPDNPNYLNFLKELDLKDSSQGFCDLDVNCYTLNESNKLLVLDGQERSPRRSDRVLVHKSAKVLSSSIFFNKKKQAHEVLEKRYTIKHLYPSLRYGWSSEVIFTSCDLLPKGLQKDLNF